MDIDNLAGSTLGNYEIETLLGRSGMGVVYKARQLNLDRPIALKILPPHLSSDALFGKRFRRETRAVARLSHPNIIQTFHITESMEDYSKEPNHGLSARGEIWPKGRHGFSFALGEAPSPFPFPPAASAASFLTR